jgi:cephalosporin-C deacetylase-like acetyl esterase
MTNVKALQFVAIVTRSHAPRGNADSAALRRGHQCAGEVHDGSRRGASDRLFPRRPWEQGKAFQFVAIVLFGLYSPARAQDSYIEPRVVPAGEQTALPGTKKFELEGDIASQMIDGVDKFLLRKLDESVARRERHWKRDFSSPAAYVKSIEPNRKRLAHILGVRDERPTTSQSEAFFEWRNPINLNAPRAINLRWTAFRDVHGEGICLLPRGAPVGCVILIPDCEESPGQLLAEEKPTRLSSAARQLMNAGHLVVIPSLIPRGEPLTRREWLYRSAFELGRGLVGYEVQKILAAIDMVRGQKMFDLADDAKIAVAGWGEGGLIALYAAALDPRIDVALVSGYFADRRTIWQEPIDRNVFGLLDQFGDAELASLIAPRKLIVEAAPGPERTFDGRRGGAPARIVTPSVNEVEAEVARAQRLVERLGQRSIELVMSGKGDGPAYSNDALALVVKAISPDALLNERSDDDLTIWGGGVNPKQRLARQIHEIDRHNQWLLNESPYVRAEFMKKLDTSSPATYEKSVEWYREYFATEVIGRFDDPLLPANPRSRKAYETDKWTGYEVVLDVFPDVFAYGLLLLPKDLKDNERRPVVVCQHGLEGRPQDTIGPQGSKAYSAFSARLAERGFITFAPQNIYIFRDRFRTLQRKANPLGKTLFSIMVPQHQQITDWLKSLPFVDSERIAFYGLSYGGKSAMRIPPLVKTYCLSICSADFNEWVWKNASSRSPYSYADKGEYEIFEFDLGSTFNYAEMAALIAPRPFMVERGHFDTVAPDETVGYEFAKVRNLYNARLKLPPDRCQIEWFVGPHTINGVGTYAFLHHHLKWPKPQ